MADPVPDAPPAELPLASNGEVKAYDRLGNKVTVPKEQVGQLYGMGGRVAKKDEVLSQQQEEDYQKHTTGEKALGYASAILPHAAQNYLSQQGIAPIRSEVEAANSGMSSAATLGMDEVAIKKALDAAGGPGAGKAYGEHLLEAREAHGGFNIAGQVVGTAAMAAMPTAGVGRVLGGVGHLGGVVESSVAQSLEGAARGAAGRALATGTSLGARGAVEGLIYGAASSINEQELGDHDLATDKIFAAGGTGMLYGGVGGLALGGAGSLAASGTRGAVGAVRSGAARALSKGEDIAATTAVRAEDATAEAAAKLATEAAPPVKEVSPLRQALGGDHEGAARSAANTMAYDALNARPSVTKAINEDVKGGAKAVGDYMNRRILAQGPDEGLVSGVVGALKGGRADELLPRIQAELAVDGAKIGDVVRATPVRVQVDDLMSRAEKIASEMASDPTRIHGAEPFRKQVAQTFEALENGGKLAFEGGGTTMDLADMYATRAKMEGVAYEMTRKDTAAGEAMKSWLREVDTHLVDKLDEAATKLGNPGEKEKLLALKREYSLGKAAEKAAEDGTNRIAGNNTFGIRESIGAAAGFAAGGVVGPLATAVGGKVLRERGSAAGAYLLSRVADMGVLRKTVQSVDEQIGRASKGLLAPPVARALPEAAAKESVHVRAEKVMRAVADYQANPEAFADRVTQQTQHLNGTAPTIASALASKLTSGMAFLASQIPVSGDPDPFDPHGAPKLSDSDAHTVAQYGYYMERPARFFEEVEHGKVTYEGVQVAKVMMPGAFTQLQQQTQIALAGVLASQGMKPSYEQRRRIGSLLEFPATPDQRPDHMPFLQANVASAGAAGKMDMPVAPAPKRPLNLASQQSSLDRLAEKGPGRR